MLSVSSYAFGATVFGQKQYVQTGSSNTYSDTFTAAPGQGTLIVLNGRARGQKRVSSATVKINRQTIFSETNFNQSAYQLETPINLVASNTVEVILENNKKGTYITVEVRQGSTSAPTVSMSSSLSSIQTGASSTLTWTSANATTASIDQGIGPVPVNGSTTVSPTPTTTYTTTLQHYSSYRSYLNPKEETLFFRDLILAVSNGSNAHRTFMESVRTHCPLKDAYGGMILGTKSFIKDTPAFFHDTPERKLLIEDYSGSQLISMIFSPCCVPSLVRRKKRPFLPPLTEHTPSISRRSSPPFLTPR
jgi:hypothetical protein